MNRRKVTNSIFSIPFKLLPRSLQVIVGTILNEKNMSTVEVNKRPERQSIKNIKFIKFNKNMLMLVLSLALGAVAVYFAKGFIEKELDFYKSQLGETVEMVSVIVPKRNMSNGEVISSRDFSIREIPAKFAHTNGVSQSTFEIAVGQRLSFDVSQGKTLLWAHLEGGIMPTFSGKVPEGKRAMSIAVDKINSISGFLQPTDSIDLLLEYKDQIFPIIQNIRVLATGTRTRVDKTGRDIGSNYNTITIEVTPEIAKKITLARSVGGLTAVLRSPKDNNETESSKMTISQLLNQPKKTYTRKKIQKKKPEVVFIIGGVGR